MDMKRSKSEQKEGSGAVAAEGPKEEYPYGLRLTLNKEELIKLGFKALPKVGDKFRVDAEAIVESVSANESSTGDYKSVSLQITDLEMDGDEKEDDKAEKIYGGSK